MTASTTRRALLGAGAAAGGLLGSLTGAGVGEEDAHVHAEGVRRGGTMLTARVDESRAARVEAVLASSGGHVDVAARRDGAQHVEVGRGQPGQAEQRRPLGQHAVEVVAQLRAAVRMNEGVNSVHTPAMRLVRGGRDALRGVDGRVEVQHVAGTGDHFDRMAAVAGEPRGALFRRHRDV